jgi:hypothetical protein
MKNAKAVQVYEVVAGSIITIVDSKSFACFTAGLAVMAMVDTVVRCW